MPPIHKPEVAAQAILRAAREAPRELWVGRASLQAIIGTMLMPGLLDRMMAKQAWDGQMTEEPLAAGQPDNLFQPVAGLHRLHGRFDDKALDKAPSLASDTVGKLALGLALAVALAVVIAMA